MLARSLRNRENTLIASYFIVVLLLIAVNFMKPFSNLGADGDGYLASFTDDFYYYLEIAKNFSKGEFSTFDGITLTNGYHPLWTAVLAALARLIPPTEVHYYIALQIIVSVSAASVAWAIFRISSTFSSEHTDAAVASGVFGVSLYLLFSRMGMEINLAIPLLLFFLLAAYKFFARPAPIRALAVGILLSLTTMARIDSIIVTAAIFIALLLTNFSNKELRKRSVVAAFILSLTPLLAYFLSNIIIFGALMPVSGAAKAVNSPFDFNSNFLGRIFVPILDLASGSFRAELIELTLPALLLLFLSLLIIARPQKCGCGPENERRLCTAATVGLIVGVALFAVAHSFRSSWLIWLWYYYPLVVASPIALFLLLASIARRLEAPVSVAVVLFFVVITTTSSSNPVSLNKLYTTAKELSSYADNHPGIYAQGDRAGLVGFLMEPPLVQLEGLVLDRAFLDFISRQSEIRDVFKHYEIVAVQRPSIGAGSGAAARPARRSAITLAR